MKRFFFSIIVLTLLAIGDQYFAFQNIAIAADTPLNAVNPLSDYKGVDYLTPSPALPSPTPTFDAQTRNTLYKQGLDPNQCPYDDALCLGSSSSTTKPLIDPRDDPSNELFDPVRFWGNRDSTANTATGTDTGTDTATDTSASASANTGATTITTDPSSDRPLINCGERAAGGAGILPGCTGEDALDTGGLVLGRFIPYLISWSIGIMGLVAFFFIVEAGIQLVLSQGNEEKAKAAQKTIISAAIGLVIATLSFILVSIASRFNLFYL